MMLALIVHRPLLKITEDFSVVHIAYRSRKILLNVFESGSSVGAVNRLAAVQPDSRGLIPIEIETFLFL